MVASMPACASFLQHLLAKTRFLSSIKSIFLLSRSKQYTESANPADLGTPPRSPNNDGHRLTRDSSGPGTNSRSHFWQVRQHFGQDALPQITSAKQESGHILKSGDSNAFNDKMSPETRGVFNEGGERMVVAHDVV